MIGCAVMVSFTNLDKKRVSNVTGNIIDELINKGIISKEPVNLEVVNVYTVEDGSNILSHREGGYSKIDGSCGLVVGYLRISTFSMR